MLLTNSKQITLAKVEQCSTLQLMLSDMQLTDDGLNELIKGEMHGLAVEDEMQRRVREMEDGMFQESVEIFKLLNDTDALLVDGLTYRQIQQTEQLSTTFRMIRENAPIYQHLNKRQKSTLINKITYNYVEKLKQSHQSECQKQADLPKNQSQNQYETAKFSLDDKIHKNSNIKTKPVHKATKQAKNDHSNKANKKKVRISSVSFCKYFCALQAPRKIRKSQINSMQTF